MNDRWFILLISGFTVLMACAEVAPEERVPMPASAAELESKADGVWRMDDQVTLSWAEIMQCTVALGTGAWSGAENLGQRLWELPGAIARLAIALGSEILRREADYINALTDEEALARIHETHENDLKTLRMLLLSIRRAIPELWIGLRQGSGWFQTLERHDKVQLVCEVTGRMAFEIVSIILTDKGLTKLAGLARIRLVEGVSGRIFELVRAARLSRVAVNSIEDIGTRLSGQRDRRWSNPAQVHGPLASAEAYETGAWDGTGNTPCPSLATYENGQWHVHSHLGSWENLAGSGYLDVIILESALLPDGAIVDAVLNPAHVGALLLTDANALIPTTVESAQANGERFVRAFLPGDSDFVVQDSLVYSSLENSISDLEQRLGLDLRMALRLTAEYWNRSPVARLDYLRSLQEEAMELYSHAEAPLDEIDVF